MKKIITFLFIVFTLFSLSSCTGSTSNNNVEENSNENNVEENSNEKKIFDLLNSYSINGSNGFDYLLEQKLNETIVNSHTIVLRIDNSSETIGSRVEYKKELNEDISQGQYTEISATAYYKNNKIATYENDSWVWKNCQLSEFASVNINSFGFDTSKVTDLNLSSSGKYSVLTFKIDDASASAFLGVSKSIKNLSFEIKLNSNLDQLNSFIMNYSQDLTNTKFSFIPYYGSVNIDLPQ